MNIPREDLGWRYNSIAVIFTAIALLVVVQTVRIQIGPQRDSFLNRTNDQEIRTITPERGQIYDRWGHIMAANTTVYEVGAELKYVENPETIALVLTGILHVNYDKIYEAASREPTSTTLNVRLAFPVTEEQKQQIQKIAGEMPDQPTSRDKTIRPPSLRGLVFRPMWMRTYPENDIASNVLGFVNYDGIGIFGVEEKYNDLLSSLPQTVRVSLDPNQASELPHVNDGASLILTIDREMQLAMEQILDQALADTGADGGTLTVMDPRTGEILAMATTPRLNLNKFWELGKVFPENVPFNRTISQPYETGSVFKVLTMAAALDSGKVKPTTTFFDTGVFEIGGVYIYNWNRGSWGTQDMVGCLEHSLNVCLAWVADKMGSKLFYSYMEAFGFGHLSGVDLAGEEPGRLKLPGDGDWFVSDLGTNAFGQGVSSTPIQMLMAVSAVANNGKMVIPHIVRSIIDRGHQYNTPTQIAGMPITSKTAHTLTDMLTKSLENESSDALVDGYRVAGKTGTGSIAVPGSGYTMDLTNASFIGWGPVDDPRFIVYVWLEKPKTSIWGSVVASPVFRQAVEQLVVFLNLPPDKVRQQMDGH